MVSAPSHRIRSGPPLLRGLLILAGLIALVSSAVGQPPCEQIGGFPPCLPPVPLAPPRPDQAVSFLDSLRNNDATFEVVLGQSRLLTLKEDLAVRGKAQPVIALGDPSVIDFAFVPPRQIRVLGLRVGTTDLGITTPEGKTYNYEVQVVPDLNVLRCQLKAMFPDASLKIAQIHDHVVVEGQARDALQVARILETIRAYLLSIQADEARKPTTGAGPAVAAPGGGTPPGKSDKPPPAKGEEVLPPPRPAPVPVAPAGVVPAGGGITVTGTVVEPRVINLIRVPGPQQVLLKVRVAELNRTAMRQIGADWLTVDADTGTIAGTQIGGANISANGTLSGVSLRGGIISSQTTLFGIFPPGEFQFFLSALRKNSVLKLLAEPNLVTLNGHRADFLAGGEFPVPVPQYGGGGIAPTITVQFQPFGVRLAFVPYILDCDVIRLTVEPEVSTIDFSIGTTLVAGGSVVPGLNIRRSHCTVELHEGQTLAIAGLLQLTMDGTTTRIPGLGDLPILGPFFQNTTNDRIEKELLVLVTPYLVEPMNPGEVPPTPGDEVNEPNDIEFYLLHRIEGRTGVDWRSTTSGEDPLRLLHLESKHVCCPHGFSD
jgi:pilus assembly protein CpaC